MKTLITILASCLSLVLSSAQTSGDKNIYLVVRGDDMGSSHAANTAFIKSYREGILRTAEVMVPCPWFPEAAKLLNENPGIDVGIHLVLTSEWENMKWRPLSSAPSLVDSDGYFYPMIWPNADFPSRTCLRSINWNMKEVEKEVRAQIEMAMKHIGHVSHVSTHMIFTGMDPTVRKRVDEIAEEYGLAGDRYDYGVKWIPYKGKGKTYDEKHDDFIKALKSLTPGKYFFIDHPGTLDPEMQALYHTGNTDVAEKRNDVTRLFTDPEVIKTIKDKGIKLVGFDSLRKGSRK